MTTFAANTESEQAHSRKPWADRFFFTDCHKQESCLGEGGYSIRARSVKDPEMTKFVSDFPQYLVPKGDVDPALAPARLALLSFCKYQVLVHSRYVGPDTINRTGNFVSHFLFYPDWALPPQDRLGIVLRSWGAPVWHAKDYGPGGEELIDPLDGLPGQGTIDDQVLQSFLANPAVATATQDLRDVVIPARLTSVEERTTLLRRTINACVLALMKKQPEREYVFIHGEPGLIALLLYGACRILPWEFHSALTFSTYEPFGQPLRQFHKTKIIGTVMANPRDDFKDDSLERRGYLIDAYSGKSSPEVNTDQFRALDRMLLMARHGDLSALKELQMIARHDVGLSLRSLDQADSIWDDLNVIMDGDGPESGRTLREAFGRVRSVPLGARLIGHGYRRSESNQGRPAGLWQKLRAACISDGALASEFQEILRQQAQLTEHFQVIHRLLLQEHDSNWKAEWDLFKSLLPEENIAKCFLALINPTDKPRDWNTLPFSIRLSVLQAWHEVAPELTRLPETMLSVARVRTSDELRALIEATPALPEQWIGQALAFSLCKELAADISESLFQGSEALLKGFILTFNTVLTVVEACDELNHLFDVRPEVFLGLYLLLAREGLDRERIDTVHFCELLKKHEVWKPRWHEIWDIQSNFEAVCVLLPPKWEISQKIWQVPIRQLGLGLFFDKGRGDRERFEWLKALAKRLERRIPDSVRDELDNWDMVLERWRSRTPLFEGWRTPLLIAAALLLGIALGWIAKLMLSEQGTEGGTSPAAISTFQK